MIRVKCFFFFWVPVYKINISFYSGRSFIIDYYPVLGSLNLRLIPQTKFLILACYSPDFNHKELPEKIFKIDLASFKKF